MKTKYLTSLVLLVAACSGGHTSEGDAGQSEAQLKKEAAEASSSGMAEGDVCGDHDWYGDGECDTFCRDADTTDCAPGCGVIVCAAFSEEPNGYCSRKAEDPCIAQDPDCAGGSEPGDPGGPDEPIACTAIAEVADGVCGREANDPCMFQDPDCPQQGGGSGSDPGPGGDTPICKAVPSPANGVCEREPNDPCLALDPDCVPDVACAEYIELSDGVCKRDPADPCIFQDPDCRAK